MRDRMDNVCVIGAGTMGSGIAAHLANIGFSVTLLDRDQESVEAAFGRARAARPPHFYVSETASKVRLGSIQENLDWVSEADWVCEAVVEKLDIKRALFEAIEPVLRPDALISTNTSGLQIDLLKEGRSDDFRRRFFGSHFFNPPRYLKLLELIPTVETDPGVIADATQFFERLVARRVVVAKDTPGFIANRYGMWSMYLATHVAERLQLTIEEVDAITGPFLGRPKTGSFRLNDVVGLDIMEDIAHNLIERCPHDPETKWLAAPASLAWLKEKGWIGGKVGQGYYKKEAGQFLSFDLQAHGYREMVAADLPSLRDLGRLPLGERVRAALELRDPVGDYLREYLVPAMRYADAVKDEISHSVQDFDRVMKWGFGWDMGPFELIDAVGADAFGIESGTKFYQSGQILGFNGVYFPAPSEPEYRTMTDFPVLESYDDFNLRELGDGVMGIGITTKMGVVTPRLVSGLNSLLRTGGLDRVVISSEAATYSVGFDLKFFASRIEEQDWDGIDSAIAEFQELNMRLHKIRSVAAVFGFCLGGGFEIAAGCQAIVAAPETQIGLPEARVGLIPGGAGTPLMRLRSQDDLKLLVGAMKTLATGAMSANADDARALGFLQGGDVTCYHPDRLVSQAKMVAMSLEVVSRPDWRTVSGPFRGMVDQMHTDLKSKGDFSNYDSQINHAALGVFCSGSYEDAIQRERESFVALCKEGLTLARIKHMIETGKPLRN